MDRKFFKPGCSKTSMPEPIQHLPALLREQWLSQTWQALQMSKSKVIIAIGDLSKQFYLCHIQESSIPYETVRSQTKTTQDYPDLHAIIDKAKDSIGIHRIVLFATHPEMYIRVSSFDAPARMTNIHREFAINERFWDLASIYTSGHDPRPALLSSTQYLTLSQVGPPLIPTLSMVTKGYKTNT